jgi:hypothetical protein
MMAGTKEMRNRDCPMFAVTAFCDAFTVFGVMRR